METDLGEVDWLSGRQKTSLNSHIKSYCIEENTYFKGLNFLTVSPSWLGLPGLRWLGSWPECWGHGRCSLSPRSGSRSAVRGTWSRAPLAGLCCLWQVLQSPVAPAALVPRPSQPCPRLLVKLQTNVHHKEMKQTNKGNMVKVSPSWPQRKYSGRARFHMLNMTIRGILDAGFHWLLLLFQN